jgi:hypothetical protein
MELSKPGTQSFESFLGRPILLREATALNFTLLLAVFSHAVVRGVEFAPVFPIVCGYNSNLFP